MIILSLLALIGCTYVSWRHFESIVHPCVVFFFTWSVAIFCALAFDFEGYSLSDEALIVLMTAAAAFGLTAVLIEVVGRQFKAPESPGVEEEVDSGPDLKYLRRFVEGYSVILIAVFPLYLRSLLSVASLVGITLIQAGRSSVGTEQAIADLVPSYYKFLLLPSSILGFIAAAMWKGDRRGLITIILAFVGSIPYSLASGTRTTMMAMAIGTISILLARRMISLRAALLPIAALMVAGVGLGMALGKVANDSSGGLYDTLRDSIGIYFGGGPVGFSATMDHPERIADPGLSMRAVSALQTTISPSTRVSDNVLDYFSASLGNLYTMYVGPWMDFGIWGVIAQASLLSLLACFSYRRLIQGSVIWMIYFAVFTNAIFGGPIGDFFLLSLTPYWMVLGIFIVFVYLPNILKQAPSPRPRLELET